MKHCRTVVAIKHTVRMNFWVCLWRVLPWFALGVRTWLWHIESG